MLRPVSRRLATNLVSHIRPSIYTRSSSSVPTFTVQTPPEPERRYASEDSPPAPPADDPNDNPQNNSGASVTESSNSLGRTIKKRGRPPKSRTNNEKEETQETGLKVPQWFLERNVERFEEYAALKTSTSSTETSGIAYEKLPDDLWQEIICHAQAGLMAPQGPSINSVAAKKSHIILQCPHDGTAYFLQDLVHRIAKEVEANLIKIDAQDLEELTGDLMDTTGTDFPMNNSVLRTLGYSNQSASETAARDEEDLEGEEDDDGPDIDPEHGRPSHTSIFSHQTPHLVQIVTSALESSGRPNINLGGLPFITKSSSDPHDTLMAFLTRILDGARLKGPVEGSSVSRGTALPRPTILYLADFFSLFGSSYGSNIHSTIQEIVREKRKSGEKLIVIGGAASSSSAYGMSSASEQIDRSYHLIGIPPSATPEMQKIYTEDHARRLRTVNLRHMYDQIKRKLGSNIPITRFPLLLNSTHGSELDSRKDLSETVWSFYRINRMASIVVGEIAQKTPICGTITQQDIVKALSLVEKVEESKKKWEVESKERIRKQEDTTRKDGVLKPIPFDDCNRYEKKLLGGVVDPDKIQVGFSSVRAPETTVKALKMLISLPLTHPEAFSHGILAKNMISGVLLFGPPGSGKVTISLKNRIDKVRRCSQKPLRKKVEPEFSKSKEVKSLICMWVRVRRMSRYQPSWACIFDGQAIFSLARKLAPCVIFLDEVDAIFASRRSDYNSPSHREIINQFMAEWDGLTSQTKGVLLMGATNRPFDIDDAIVRRMPRRILVDLPTVEDRKEILRIHLQEETLDSDIDLAEIATRTNLFSGSDLKNLCVAAAMSAVTESSSTQHSKRVLRKSHIEVAFDEIAPSISDDMATLTELRKWDERYGDGAGKKARNGKRLIGFGSALQNPSTRIRQTPGV
ncbi:Protein MSP1 [Neolecta irregularis DAH-3]|uniref:Protein MSP1 n=1 Tax=Neolecta irregularis (strain DAH-3) TaxID=1198029 RepID=A0A1U7LHT1_NEOID|nr:Protein MSP1 [Neolecta irregularis DAH-3]|eukprot:OLL22153.1 Protein MSP1 [Neolecta irregularis DAH-3]